MAGRRLPNNVHDLQGTKQKCRHGESSDPLLEAKYPAPPAVIKANEAALKKWNEVKKIMEPAEIYTAADVDALTQYCLMMSDYISDPKEFPATKLAQLRLVRKDLYLDPESRAKVTGKAGTKTNPFDAL